MISTSSSIGRKKLEIIRFSFKSHICLFVSFVFFSQLILRTRRQGLSPTFTPCVFSALGLRAHSAPAPIQRLSTANNLTVTCLSLLFHRTVQFDLQAHTVFLLPSRISTNTQVKTVGPVSSLSCCQEFFPATSSGLRNMWFWPWQEVEGLFKKKKKEGKKNKQSEHQNCPLATSVPLQAAEPLCQPWSSLGETPQPHGRHF